MDERQWAGLFLARTSWSHVLAKNSCGLFAGGLHGLAPAQPYILPLSFSYNASSRWHKSAKLIRLIERTPDWDEALVQPKSRAAGSVKEKMKDYFRLSLEVKSRIAFWSGINQLSLSAYLESFFKLSTRKNKYSALLDDVGSLVQFYCVSVIQFDVSTDKIWYVIILVA